jgi:hypothetical protein
MKRHLNVARRLARDETVPRWLRAILIFGILPIPGPVDNVALAVGAVVLFTLYRDRVAAQYALERHLCQRVQPLDTWGAWS